MGAVLANGNAVETVGGTVVSDVVSHGIGTERNSDILRLMEVTYAKAARQPR